MGSFPQMEFLTGGFMWNISWKVRSVYKGTSVGVIGLVNQKGLLFLTMGCLSANLQIFLYKQTQFFSKKIHFNNCIQKLIIKRMKFSGARKEAKLET